MEKINLNNISLSYETMGQGSDVLLLHGFPSSMYMWNDIKNKLVETGSVSYTHLTLPTS